MNARMLAPLALALCASGTVLAADLKPGLWEFKSRTDMPGMPDMSAQMAQMQEQMKSMPPEARRMMEQQMAGHGVAMGKDGAVQVCITPDSARNGGVWAGKSQGDCSYTNTSTTATLVRGTINCTKPKATGDFEAQLDGPTHFTSKVNMKSADGAMKVDTDARWVAADCGKIKPTAR